MDVIKLLDYLQEVLDTASKIPMSNKIMVNKKEISDIIEQIINFLPDEFKKAQWVCEQKEKILRDAQEQAESIKKESLEMVKRRVESHDYVREAELKGNEIIMKAQKKSKIIKNGARDYALEILQDTEKKISLNHEQFTENLRKEMEEFNINIDSYIKETTSILNENIEELKNVK